MTKNNKGQNREASVLNDPNAATTDHIHLTKDETVRSQTDAAAIAVATHTALENKAATFAEGFQTAGVKAVQTIREFVEGNRETLTEIRKFFSHNKNKKVKGTLCGCLTFAEYCERVLHCNDCYVRQIFAAKVFASPEVTDSSKEEGNDDSEEGKPPVSRSVFANRHAMRTVKVIAESSYTDDDKRAIVSVLLKELMSYAGELRNTLTVQPEATVTETQAEEAAV